VIVMISWTQTWWLKVFTVIGFWKLCDKRLISVYDV
jgi:hypothetical protein